MHQLTGDFYTVGEILGHTLAGIGASLGLSMNSARYVDVRLERKKEVLDAYHNALEKADPAQAKEAAAKKAKGAAKKKSHDISI
ncbi:hypothetical protein [Eisenbergiella porci]|uniref:hypothetical protein n=1 Tax=Eisenbergiella porci TaxID=2652274 RepID=UPI002A7FA6DC|nr:hypothetical protein [Eisenbergiella porci]